MIRKDKKIFPLFLLFITVAINLLFTAIPLLNTLHYETSVLNSIFLSLFSGYLTLYFNTGSNVAKKLFPNDKYYYYILFALLIIPFGISFTSTILCQHCPISEGIYFYLLFVLPALFIGSTLGVLSEFLSKKYRYLLFTLLWLVLLFSFLPELYYNPQIYFYNAIFGYFPGTMYDQNIEITKTMVLYRTLNIIFSVLILYVLKLSFKLKENGKLIVILIVISGYLMFGFAKSSLGFATSIHNIELELKGNIETKHFKIILPEKLTETEKKVAILNHEFYYNEIASLLKIETYNKIYSFLFKTGAQKKNLFGSGNADVAKLWISQIYINYEHYNNSLKHEMAHVFSSKIGTGLFKMPANYNPAMLEGFAMAIENNYDDFEIDYLTYLAIKNNYKVSLKKLFSNFSFFTQTSSLSYLYAGSFIKYLANKYGWEKIKLLYSNLEFEKIYNKNVALLEKEFLEYENNLNYKNNKEAANLYFGRVPLVKKVCPRATAKQLKLAWKNYKIKHYKKAALQFRNVYNYSNTYSALLGVVVSNIKLAKYKVAEKYLKENIHSFKGTSYFYNLENILGDVYSNLNKLNLAKEKYENLLAENPRNNYTNEAGLKLYLLKSNIKGLKSYINEKDNRKKILHQTLLNEPTDAVIQILTLQKFSDTEYFNEIETIKKIITNRKFSSDTYFQLAKLAFNFLDFTNAENFINTALKNPKPERKEILEELLKKIEWSKEYIKQKNYDKP